MDKKRYVLGFAFNETQDLVVLICKNKPEWQKGKLNGVGGKIEVGETTHEAMSREFEEEAGVRIHPTMWDMFFRMEGPGYEVHCFRTRIENLSLVTTITDEAIHIIPVTRISTLDTIKNLSWLVPMALDEEVCYAMADLVS